MSEKGFQEYIEKRSVAEIMEDYGEQRDEWETLLMIENGAPVQFRHSNGKSFFCEQYAPADEAYVPADSVLETMAGKTVEEQMEHYYVTESRRFYSTAYGEVSREDLRKYAVKLSEYDGVKLLLLKDKVLVGAKIKAHWGDGVLLPERPVCTYYACDNEGSGTKEREDYAYLMFVN